METPKSKNPFETEADELSDAELLLRTAKLPEPEDPETTLPDDRKSDLSVRHPSSSSIKRHFNESDDEHASQTCSNNSQLQATRKLLIVHLKANVEVLVRRLRRGVDIKIRRLSKQTMN